ncbi:MAG: GntR family transcriptional regulator [Acutalibacteraceae bacterium]|nr:GntR family transcriptional regulator [Acutalibacteraceae bacterium]
MITHKTVSLADQVFEHIERDILSGKYERGEIITEGKLSAELGVSRTPIREALRRLDQEHLIEESGKGSVVIGISEKDLEDIFLIRKQLECLAASMAAKNHTDEQLAELKETLELQEFYVTKADTEHVKYMDNKFHRILYKLTGSTVFFDTLVPLHRKIQKYRRASLQSKSRAAESVQEHRKIYEAIALGDEKLAYETVLEHIENAYNHIKKG